MYPLWRPTSFIDVVLWWLSTWGTGHSGRYVHTQRYRSYDVRTIHVALSSGISSVVWAFTRDDTRHLPYDSRRAVGPIDTTCDSRPTQWMVQPSRVNHTTRLDPYGTLPSPPKPVQCVSSTGVVQVHCVCLLSFYCCCKIGENEYYWY
jgi:hypothetical protein